MSLTNKKENKETSKVLLRNLPNKRFENLITAKTILFLLGVLTSVVNAKEWTFRRQIRRPKVSLGSFWLFFYFFFQYEVSLSFTTYSRWRLRNGIRRCIFDFFFRTNLSCDVCRTVPFAQRREGRLGVSSVSSHKWRSVSSCPGKKKWTRRYCVRWRETGFE